LQIATVLSQQFASHGLQFFKVNKTITHVSVARPHYLDLALTPVSEGVKRIVDYINSKPRCTRRQLMAALAPAPTPVQTPPAPVPEQAEGQPPAPPAPPSEPEPTAEQNALIGDLHWLIHQGHVIEFANGTLETAKKPLPRPPKKEAKPAETTGNAAGELTQPEPQGTEPPAETAGAAASAEQGTTPSGAETIPPAEPIVPPADPESASNHQQLETEAAMPSVSELQSSAGSSNMPPSEPPPVPEGKPPAESPVPVVPSPS
jgi:hypothetical protein